MSALRRIVSALKSFAKRSAGTILRIVMPIALLVAMFFPSIGMIANYKVAVDHPFLGTLVLAIWGILMAVNLPLDRARFRMISTVFLLAVIIVANYLWSGLTFENNGKNVFIMCLNVGLVFGWWTISNKFFRWYRSVTPVDDADTGDHLE